MEDIGRTLAEARLLLGKSYEEVTQETRINIEHLKLLEANDFDFLPATYIKAYLKDYARALGLNTTEICQKFENETKVNIEGSNDITKGTRSDAGATILSDRFLIYCITATVSVLLVSLAFMFFDDQDKSTSQHDSGAHTSLPNKSVAEISIRHEHDGHSATENPVIQLTIRARNDLVLDLNIDGDRTEQLNIRPDENLVWRAEERIDVVFNQSLSQQDVGRMNNVQQDADSTNMRIAGSRDLAVGSK